jgi:hypothetical protein
MKKVILFLAVFTFAAFSYLNAQPYQTNAPALTLHEASSVCVPDGIANTDGTEPWTSTWIDMAAKKTANTKDEMGAKFQIAYNDEFLWVIGQQSGNATMDTGAVAIPNSWERDDFETFVGIDTIAYSRKGVTKDINSQFRLQRAATYPWAFDDAHSIGKNNASFKIGQVDAGDGSFVQEWQMPWKGFIAAVTDTSGTFDGSYIKFEIQAADNTTGAAGGRNDQRFWINPSDNEYQDTRTQSVIYLADKVNTGIKPAILRNDNVTINTLVDNVLKISMPVNCTIYNIEGQAVLKANNVSSINVSGLSSGLYIFKTNNQSLKFVKR